MKNKQQFIKQFISYLFVGGGATIVEWVGFWLFDHCLHIQYLIATAFAFFFSTFANWLFGRLLTFKNSDKNIFLELAQNHNVRQKAAACTQLPFLLLLFFLIQVKILYHQIKIRLFINQL